MVREFVFKPSGNTPTDLYKQNWRAYTRTLLAARWHFSTGGTCSWTGKAIAELAGNCRSFRKDQPRDRL